MTAFWILITVAYFLYGLGRSIEHAERVQLRHTATVAMAGALLVTGAAGLVVIEEATA